MAFLDRIFRGGEITAQQKLNASYIESAPLESPWSDNSHLETLTLSSLYGLDSADSLPVTRDLAMSIASVAKGRNLICSSIARMPLVALRNGSPVKSQPVFLQQLQRGTPNFITVSWIVDHLIFFGRAFLLIEEFGPDGRPRSVVFVPEWKAETDEQGRLVKAFGKAVAQGGYIRIDANHEGFLKYGKDLIREAKEIDRAAAEAGASPVPSILLSQKEGADLTQEEVAGLLAQWSANRRKRFGSAAYVNKAIDVEAIGASSENLLIDARNYSTLQVARALSLPAWSLEGSVAGSSLNYSNSSSRVKEILDFGLAPYIAAIEETLSLFTPTGQKAAFDTTVILRGAFGERAESYLAAKNSGVWTADELRAMENLEPLPAAAEPISEKESA